MNLKAKINATSLGLSAFAVDTLAAGLQVDAIPINFDMKKKDDERAPILNVELIITDKNENTQTPVYGEIAICDFITHVHNSQKPASQHAIRIGSNLNFDNQVQKLSHVLRPLTEKSAILKDTSVKDDVKAFAKELEESGFVADLVDNGKYGSFSMVHAMFFCYLEPVSKLLNKKLQTALKKVMDSA